MKPTATKPSLILLLFCLIQITNMQAQTKPGSLVGEYYLKGVQETASGFKLEKDSSFQFYFSYGALDRYGEGKWSVKENKIVFNSNKKPVPDFALIDSSIGDRNRIAIQMKGLNEFLVNHIYCKITGGGKVQEGMMDKEGQIRFAVQPVDSIELVLEFCAEKKSVYAVSSKNHSFTFKPEPWLMEVFFENFSLSIDGDELEGGHPLSSEKNFHYAKAE